MGSASSLPLNSITLQNGTNYYSPVGAPNSNGSFNVQSASQKAGYNFQCSQDPTSGAINCANIAIQCNQANANGNSVCDVIQYGTNGEVISKYQQVLPAAVPASGTGYVNSAAVMPAVVTPGPAPGTPTPAPTNSYGNWLLWLIAIIIIIIIIVLLVKAAKNRNRKREIIVDDM